MESNINNIIFFTQPINNSFYIDILYGSSNISFDIYVWVRKIFYINIIFVYNQDILIYRETDRSN